MSLTPLSLPVSLQVITRQYIDVEFTLKYTAMERELESLQFF